MRECSRCVATIRAGTPLSTRCGLPIRPSQATSIFFRVVKRPAVQKPGLVRSVLTHSNPEPEKVGPAPKPVEDNPAPPSGGSSGQGPNPLAADQPAPVTDAIKLSFGPPAFTSITATVTNSSQLKATCTYDASPSSTHRDFTVPPNGSTDLTFNGLSLGATYHAVVSCHDASGKQPQEIGHAETDVTF